MQTNSNNIILSQDEFMAFVLIYAAHIDFDYSKDEVTFIMKRTDPTTYDKMLNLFERSGDYDAMKIILSHKEKYFCTQEKQNKLYDLFTALFKIDGDFSKIEKNFIPFFKKMVESDFTGI